MVIKYPRQILVGMTAMCLVPALYQAQSEKSGGGGIRNEIGKDYQPCPNREISIFYSNQYHGSKKVTKKIAAGVTQEHFGGGPIKT